MTPALFCLRCPYRGGCYPQPGQWCEQGLAQADPIVGRDAVTDIETAVRAVPLTCGHRVDDPACMNPGLPDFPALAAVMQGMVEAARKTLRGYQHDYAEALATLAEQAAEFTILRRHNASLVEQGQESKRLKVALHDLVEDVKSDAQRRTFALGIDSPSMRAARAALRATPEAAE